MIKVGGKLVEVTPDVYYAYFRMERQERWQEEKQQGHAVVSYDALDDGETVGVEVVPDLTTPSMEEAVMTREIHEKLHRAVEALPKTKRELIHAIYFDGMTTREYAKLSGLRQTGGELQAEKNTVETEIFYEFYGKFLIFSAQSVSESG